MDYTEAKQRIGQLRDVLRENSRRYYVDNAPTMSDQDYDFLMHELEALEAQYPELLTPDSPTQRVGSDIDAPAGTNAEVNVRNDFAKVPHRYPMLSLGNTYNIAEIEEFAARAEKALDTAFTYSCELKFDGTAICLTYRNGRLLRALTRGDGVVGDDVTENVRHISAIPGRLCGSGYPEEFEIRGEILMPYASFERLNAEREEIGEQPFANPRNAASGSLKLLDPEEPEKELGKAPAEFYSKATLPQFVPADERKHNFDTFECPFTEDEAKCEASRCLQCDLRLAITKPRLWNEY